MRVSGFSAHWLAMREGADAKARSSAAVHALHRWLDNTAPINVIDLGCGSGSNLRWLAPRIAASQRWHLVDNDRQLLTQASHSLRDWAAARTRPPGDADEDNLALAPGATDCTETLCLREHLTAQLTPMDLSAQLPSLHHAHLLSASALLDLVSRDWLAALIRHGADQQVAMLFALNYDGRMRFTPAHAHDALVRDAVNRDQSADKGFGPALGPGCVAALHSECVAHGYRVTQWRSDWSLGADDQAMHAQLVTDFAHIAKRNLPSRQHEKIDAWQGLRREIIGNSTLHIGHADVLALPWKPRTATTRQAPEHLAEATSQAHPAASSPSR